MRPRFDVDIDVEVDALFLALRERANARGFRLQLAGEFADLRVPADDEHIFSPVLQVAGTVRDETERRRLGCRFSPHPNVWTGFMALYFALGCGGTAGMVYGMSQWMLDRAPWALLAVPAAVALMAFVYGAAFIGQGLGSGQMYELHAILDGAVSDSSAAHGADA